MKTSKVINLLTTAINAASEANDLVVHMDWQNEQFDHDTGDMWTSVHSLQSPGCELVRDLWDELPESLRTEVSDALVRNLYPHLHSEDRYAGLRVVIMKLHTIIYDLWGDMVEARDKYGFKR